MSNDSEHPQRPLRRAIGAVSLFIATTAFVLLLLSRSDPWLIGAQYEPRWSWAIGSGRLKIWVAEPGVPQKSSRWTSSWYRGLDGRPIRWDLTLSRGTTGSVIVIAVPLWLVAAVFALSGGWLVWRARSR
jgi:hypothetical protein